MKRTKQPKPAKDLLGKSYPSGEDAVSRRIRLRKYALESLMIPLGIVFLELYIDFYVTWDEDTYTVHLVRMIVSFFAAYAIYFILTYYFTERRIRKYNAWKAAHFNDHTT